ncbi:MAG TPA: hypothetical protein V6D14_31610 [Coleofasciculaceae cyanobacterium]
MSMLQGRQRLYINSFLFVFLVLVVITITSIYLYKERTFHYWDYTNYQNLTIDKAIEFGKSRKWALYMTWKSTGNDYSDIPTLLLIPFLLIFGDSRLIYILGTALVYLLPFALVMGAIATKLIPSYPRTVYWSTAFLTLLIPVAWTPTLRGYPDVGAALLIAIAIVVYLQDLQLKQPWRIALIGFLITLAALFRRHFVYDGIAFFGAIALHTLITYVIQVRQHSREAKRNLFKTSVRITLTVAASLITLAVLGLPFLKTVLTTNYSQLYSSYEVTPTANLWYYSSCYGWIACILAGLGFIAGIRTRLLVRPVAVFIVLFSSLSLIQWCLKVKQLGVHYTLHFTPLIVLGITAFGWTAWNILRGKTRILVLIVSGVYLILNAAIGLGAIDIASSTPSHLSKSDTIQVSDTVATKLRRLFSANYSPLIRTDYDEVARLITYLHYLAPTNKKNSIYIAASSAILNQSIVANGEKTLYKQDERLEVFKSPDIDSRDYYPLDGLLQAQYVIIATPFQYHLRRPEEQKVVKVVIDAFKENWDIAKDFTRLPVEFTLNNGVIVNVYKRVRSTSLETALQTLRAMHSYLGKRPEGQHDWLSISESPGHIMRYLVKKFQKIGVLSTKDNGVDTTSFLYIGKLSKQVKVTGNLKYSNNQCTGSSLSLSSINTLGQVINTVKLDHRPSDASDFTLPLQTRDAAYLLFNISVNDHKNEAINRCLMKIEPLSVEAFN